MLEPLAAEQDELLFGKVGVDERQGNAVEGEVPGGEPGVFPLVGHRDDLGGADVAPIVVAAALALGRRRRLGRVAAQPGLDFVVVELLRPEQAGEGLALDQARVVG